MTKVMINKYRKEIKNIVKIIGYDAIAKRLHKMNIKELERNVIWVINYEIARGRGCQYLTNPLTRKKSRNPMRPKYLKAKVILKKVISRLKTMEREAKLKKK